MMIELLADIYPFPSSAFHLTAGLYINNNTLEGKGTTSGNYDIGNTTYSGAQVGTLTADVEVGDFSPYLGLGWDTTLDIPNASIVYKDTTYLYKIYKLSQPLQLGDTLMMGVDNKYITKYNNNTFIIIVLALLFVAISVVIIIITITTSSSCRSSHLITWYIWTCTI